MAEPGIGVVSFMPVAVAAPSIRYPNHIISPRFTPPERGSFKPRPLRASCNLLIRQASSNRTKTGVVRLRQRKWPAKDRKRPKMGSRASARGSDKRPQRPKFCAIPTGLERQKKNVPTGETGGGKLTRRIHSFCWGCAEAATPARSTL
jgi:hypothetical protein